MSRGNGLKVIVKGCHNVKGYKELAKKRIGGLTAEVQLGVLPCSGKVEPQQILRFFERGADGALILACPKGACRFVEGNLRSAKRVAYAGQWLEELGIEPERARFHFVDYQTDDLETLIKDFHGSMTKLGPTGVAGR